MGYRLAISGGQGPHTRSDHHHHHRTRSAIYRGIRHGGAPPRPGRASERTSEEADDMRAALEERP